MWAWLKKWWKWLAVGVAMVVSFLVGILLRKAPVVVSGEDPEKKKAEDNTKAKDEQAVVVETKEQDVAKKEHDHEVAVVVDLEEKNEKQLEGDPTAENDFIKKVGQDVLK